MAINPVNLLLRTTNESIFYPAQGSIGLSFGWEVYHATLGEVVDSGMVSMTVAKTADLLIAHDALMSRANTALGSVREHHKALPAIAGNSLFDADLVLDGWDFDADGASHPVCGSHAIPDGDIDDRINNILNVCAAPPVWMWSDSPGAGELRAKCLAVAGASGYEVYNGDILLASPANLTTWQTLSVSAGTYVIRAAGVVGGQTGILSFPVTVTVT